MSALLIFGQSTMSASFVREGRARTCRVLVNTTAFEQSRRNSKNAPRCCLPTFKRILSLDDFGYEVLAAPKMYLRRIAKLVAN
jgi:hypothetical protein